MYLGCMGSNPWAGLPQGKIKRKEDKKMTKKLLQERCEYFSEITGQNIEARYYNGYVHVVNAENGTIYAVGTKQYCYDAIYNMMQGFWLASVKYAN